MSADSQPVYVPRDVVYGADPFKGAEAARPWLMISNHEGKPFHGDQYIALTLTTNTWNGLIELDDQDWSHGAEEQSYRSMERSVARSG